jgi:mRNA interferase MazF
VVNVVEPRRGSIYFVDFEPVRGSEQGRIRPALVIQNDVGNQSSSTTIVAAVTSRMPSRRYPFHVWLPEDVLPKPSLVMCEQIRTVAVERFTSGPVAVCSPELMREVDRALVRSLGIEL